MYTLLPYFASQTSLIMADHICVVQINNFTTFQLSPGLFGVKFNMNVIAENSAFGILLEGDKLRARRIDDVVLCNCSSSPERFDGVLFTILGDGNVGVSPRLVISQLESRGVISKRRSG